MEGNHIVKTEWKDKTGPVWDKTKYDKDKYGTTSLA